MQATPTDGAERVQSLDQIRGVAILGILIMNIIVMGQPFAYFNNPDALGGASIPEIIDWSVTFALFEASFRSLFGILFGAGVCLFFQRIEARTSKRRARWLHLRRSGWLIVLGLVDAYLLLWEGDILFLYGVTAMILWLFRDLGMRALTLWIAVFTLISLGFSAIQAWNTTQTQAAWRALQPKIEAGMPLTDQEKGLEEAIYQAEAFHTPSREWVDDYAARVTGGWTSAFFAKLPIAVLLQTVFLLVFGLWDSLINMLIGMVLFKSGLLQGGGSTALYARMMAVGYGVGLLLRGFHLSAYARSDFSIEILHANALWYNLERLLITAGHLGVLMLLLKSGRLPLAANLAAIGRTALSNYLLQSVIALSLFVFLGMFGKLLNWQLHAIMIGIWALQLWISPIWMKHYRYGPAEWLWRSLTYWRLQPMRRGGQPRADAKT